MEEETDGIPLKGGYKTPQGKLQQFLQKNSYCIFFRSVAR